MLLKSLELSGYKTFATKTTFEFAENVTAIVGPNGSGKSNIADALRWVLGEQAYSLLRARKTADMIFSGSEQRPRSGMASATILFDNIEGWLPIDFSEVSIARRAYRDGQNEYLINGQKVRLKDIAELLGRSALAERTYTIIGQGLVDKALSLGSDERRKLFEEAAGIGLYRSRREESLRRLETTRRNLERVEDILAELRPRLRSLERQARRAQAYEQIKGEMQVMLREWYGFHWHRAQRELTQARQYTRSREAQLGEAQEKQENQDQQARALRERIHNLRAKLNEWHRQLAGLHNRRERINRELAVAEERQRVLAGQRDAMASEITHLDEEIHLHRDRLESAQLAYKRLEKELQEAHQGVQEAEGALESRRSERQAIAKELESTKEKWGQLQNRLGQLDARREELLARSQRQKVLLEETRLEQTSIQKSLHLLKDEGVEIEARFRKAEAERQQAEVALENHLKRIDDREREKKAVLANLTDYQAREARLQARLDVLDQAEKSLTGYASGTRLLLQAAQENRLKGTLGALSSQLYVSAAYEKAISAALGAYLDAFLLKDDAEIEAALQLLEEAEARAAIIPLNRVDSRSPLTPPLDPDILGSAAELVKVSSSLRPAVNLVLGDVFIVRDRQAAQRLLGDIPAGTRFVTLQGEIFHPEGQILTGGESASGTIGRHRIRQELANSLEELQRAIREKTQHLERLEEQIEHLLKQQGDFEMEQEASRSDEEAAREAHRVHLRTLDEKNRQAEWVNKQLGTLESDINQARESVRQVKAEWERIDGTLARHKEGIRALNNRLVDLPLEAYLAEVSHWETRVAVVEQARQDAAVRRDERAGTLREVENRLERRRSLLAELTSEISELEKEQTHLRREEEKVGAEIQELQASIQPAESALEGAEKEQDTLREKENRLRKRVSLAERQHAQAQIALARKQEALENLRQRIEDDFGLVAFEYAEEIPGPTPLPFGEMVQELPLVAKVPAGLGDAIKRLRAQMRRMGAINPEAQKEYQEVKTRHEFLTTQVKDLKKAEVDVKEVIAELDVLMEREFRKTFDSVAAEFRSAFQRLFGGGSAKLVLTDPEDMTHTGVDIDARLPGRRTQGLALLSGGERSLTATALIFALLKVSPTPFCVLDEVDAMLDEANVGRFSDMLRELSQDTQFIIITHNRTTVQIADIIYGVTMGRDSTSQVLGLKLDEVAETLEV